MLFSTLVAMLLQHFPPGQPWDAGYFEWNQQARVRLMLLSPGYFGSPACIKEFKAACNDVHSLATSSCVTRVSVQVPQPRGEDQAIIPVVLTPLEWKYPSADPDCPADLKAEHSNSVDLFHLVLSARWSLANAIAPKRWCPNGRL